MPRFSLLTLLFVSTMVCIALATLLNAPYSLSLQLAWAVALLGYIGGCLLYSRKHYSDVDSG